MGRESQAESAPDSQDSESKHAREDPPQPAEDDG